MRKRMKSMEKLLPPRIAADASASWTPRRRHGAHKARAPESRETP
jgi:hypothetical protein